MTTTIHHPLKVAILAIGTEITTGEIINANAATLASRLTDSGFVCDLHLTVPDEKNLMLWAIRHSMIDHGLIFITGGLGPTTDDFTRDIIAAVAGKNLVWSESSWAAIVQRLDSVSAPHAESNKQQAFFPEGATIFPNNHGTAAAFSLRCGSSLIFALPGPPKEIDGLWNDHLGTVIASLAPKEKNQTPLRWRCLGLSESKLGEIVEQTLNGSGLLTGYRSHAPYIDVKVWTSETQRVDFETNWRSRLESAIAPWLIGRDADDVADQFRHACPLAIPFYILDRTTQGYLAQRIYSKPLPAGCQLAVITADYSAPMPKMGEEVIVATVSSNFETGAWQLSLTGTGPHKTLQDQSRFRGVQHAGRLRAFIGEKVLITLRDWLSTEA
jgi:nicotinamide-nucleotide amidase